MNKDKNEIYFLGALLFFVLFISVFIFKPFIYALILAGVFATIFSTLHNRILVSVKGRRGLASILSTLVVLFVVIVPIAFLTTQIVREAGQVYSYLSSPDGSEKFARSIEGLLSSIDKLIPGSGGSIEIDQYATSGFNWIVPHLSLIVSRIAQIILNLIVFLIALYYMFKDGEELKKRIIRASPLRDEYDKIIFKNLSMAINSVMKGNISVALVQGTLTAIGFFIFGVPNAVLWGSTAAIAALVPAMGTSLVLGPGVLYLILNGNTTMGIGLAIWGVLAVGLIDNFLGPMLVRRGIQIHQFIILLSILGGLSFFGPIGFLLGPLVVSLLFALVEISLNIRNGDIPKSS